jgi:tetratricopeptide (TPR) repeat protein
MKLLAIAFLAAAVGLTMPVIPVLGKIGAAGASAGSLRTENASRRCELRKEKEIIRKKKLNAQEWIRQGLECLGAKNYEGAREAFRNAIEINEGFLQIFNRAAAMHMRYGNQQQANHYLKKMEQIEADLGFAYFQRGIASRESGKCHEAIFDFTRAIELYSIYSPAYLERGRAYQKLGDYRQAIDDYSVVVKRNPRDAAAYCERSSAYIGLEFLPLAIIDCDRAIALDPHCTRAYVDRGKAYQKLGHPEKGIENFKIAARLGSPEAQGLLKDKEISW